MVLNISINFTIELAVSNPGAGQQGVEDAVIVTDQRGVPVSNYKDQTIIEQIRLLLFPFFNYPLLYYDQEKEK